MIVKGGERVPAHYLVFVARCRDVCESIIEANGTKYLEAWSHLSKHVVLSFLSYLYCGILDLELNSTEDMEAAKYFRNAYPNLEIWRSYQNYFDQTEY